MSLRSRHRRRPAIVPWAIISQSVRGRDRPPAHVAAGIGGVMFATLVHRRIFASIGIRQNLARRIGSNRFRSHLDGATRAFLGADAAALAVVELELETHAGSKFDHGIIGTYSVTIVAFEAIAAG